MSDRQIWVGLGNPEKRYEKNRHNAGFMFVDSVQTSFSFEAWQEKKKCSISQGTVEGIPITLLKPLDYMNRSGPPVAAFLNFYKIALEQVIVFYDDMALPLGKIRLKQGGGSAGHNGIRSLDSTVGKNYWRLRIGIDHPGDRDQVTDYVLSNFTGSERKALEDLFEVMKQYLPLLVEGQRDNFVSRVLNT